MIAFDKLNNVTVLVKTITKSDVTIIYQNSHYEVGVVITREHYKKYFEEKMSTNIQWCDETINPIVGCSKISEGCKNCYAATAAKSARLQQFSQYQKVAKWDGTVSFVESQLSKPLHWRGNKRIFVCSMSDLFHENIPDEWRDKVFAMFTLCQQHTFQILTKRPEIMVKYFGDAKTPTRIQAEVEKLVRTIPITKYQWAWNLQYPLPNVWLGVTVENQFMANKRIPLLLKTPAAIRFLSCEPLLEDIQFESLSGIDWVIAGGESGINARQCHLDWLQSIASQCKSNNVPVFIKQLGSNPIRTIRYISGGIDYCSLKLRDRKGGDISEFPIDLRCRNFPTH